MPRYVQDGTPESVRPSVDPQTLVVSGATRFVVRPQVYEGGQTEEDRNRHRDGFSCKTPVGYTYDANGHRRWCTDCGDELGEQAWVEGGAEVPNWALGLVFVGLGLVLLAVVALCTLGGQPTNERGPAGTTTPGRATPSPYSFPGPNGGPR